jgi:hypothetical protein
MKKYYCTKESHAFPLHDISSTEPIIKQQVEKKTLCLFWQADLPQRVNNSTRGKPRADRLLNVGTMSLEQK